MRIAEVDGLSVGHWIDTSLYFTRTVRCYRPWPHAPYHQAEDLLGSSEVLPLFTFQVMSQWPFVGHPETGCPRPCSVWWAYFREWLLCCAKISRCAIFYNIKCFDHYKKLLALFYVQTFLKMLQVSSRLSYNVLTKDSMFLRGTTSWSGWGRVFTKVWLTTYILENMWLNRRQTSGRSEWWFIRRWKGRRELWSGFHMPWAGWTTRLGVSLSLPGVPRWRTLRFSLLIGNLELHSDTRCRCLEFDSNARCGLPG